MLWKLGFALILAWAVILPPVFTGGACTGEFDAESRRIYRDDSILVQLQYDRRERLARTQVDMASFKSLPIPFTHAAIDWAK